ncbi:MAG: aminoglycoside phosphotransferase family protein [Defluviitaleaceae bacterium]|nr:aminoglycoside phosphotransferase family protein [Defluviitaleaceae bacterium]
MSDLKIVLSKMLSATITSVTSQNKTLQGGTIGEVCLISGTAETVDNKKIPYKLVLKITKKWERHGDPESWRREYDLYASEFDMLFSDSLRWPKCYHHELNENETKLWLEYIDGVSGVELTPPMYERAAKELGRFQGKLYAEQPSILQSLSNLSNTGYLKNFYMNYRLWPEVYDYIRSNDCELPRELCEMLIKIDEQADEIFLRIEKLPIVLCHRDFWVTNIFYSPETDVSDRSKTERSDTITLIDWDTTGWGYLGEDIASLIADDADVIHMLENFKNCIPAYYKGFSEYADISHIKDNCVYEIILLMYGYRTVEGYKYAETPEGKELCLKTLQKICEMGRMV